MKILWLANIPSPYRVNFFNELGKYCELTVLFEKRVSTERDVSWKNTNIKRFKAVFLKGKNIGVAEAFCPSVIKYINNKYDHIVVTTFSDPTGILAILYMRVKNIVYEIESDGAFPGSGKGIKERIKRFLISHSVLCFSTSIIHDNYYYTYGAEKSKVIRYPFTSVFEKDILPHPLTPENKREIKSVIGVTEEYMILAVGQFIYRKGYDVLIKALVSMPKNIGVYIVGGQATKEYLSLKEHYGLNNLHFIEFKTGNDLKNYYYAADVFVHPTREDIWGLVINEAMSCALPVVTTEKCIAGMQMIKNAENGCIVPINDECDLKLAIISCMNNPKMAENALDTARWYTLEKMTLSHMNTWRSRLFGRD